MYKRQTKERKYEQLSFFRAFKTPSISLMENVLDEVLPGKAVSIRLASWSDILTLERFCVFPSNSKYSSKPEFA